ncbi:MAG TPA: phospholipase C, phosphocholine-specific [Pedobacter sp.]
MDSRRDFLKKAALFSGAAGLANVIPMSIQRAMAIEATPGTTFHDAEHIVFLMQENRSFDHMFGKLKGVRGFNDPRPHILPNKNKVWLQQNASGNTFAPFHVDINKTKITWQGGLPHSWSDQVAARNQGKYDQWVPVKSLMSLAYYDRKDIPFYYALADAFTICDHSFCSSLTGTTPNRLFFWSGTIRPEQNGEAVAAVNNSQAESHTNTFVDWDTFPELLEDHGIDWKIYQNELWTSKLQDQRIGDWVDNYGDNALEYIKRYNVKLSDYFRKHGDKTNKKEELTPEQVTEKYNRLSQKERNLIDKAFATNINMPADHLELEPFTFTDDLGKTETVDIPKHDIFHQFRSDVEGGKLPTVSWLVAPQRFSDHTSSPLYGTWYVSEALDILTKNPEIWKKTIFVLTYDENDGYFDHIPPFVAPNPNDPDTGKVSENMNIDVEWEAKKGSPLGLGYRVPMLIASPWSKGGYVNSQVFDHTSSLMFLENLLSKKTGKKIRSKQISDWRRAVCGDLSSVFRPYNGEKQEKPEALKRETVVTGIQNAKNKPAQTTPAALTKEEIAAANASHAFAGSSPDIMPMQEKGTRKACALPYQLMAEANLNQDKTAIALTFESGKTGFGQLFEPAGSAFTVSSLLPYAGIEGKTWNYAVRAGDQISHELELNKFQESSYDLHLRAPNGFFRNFRGSKDDPELKVSCVYERSGLLKEKLSGNLIIQLENFGQTPLDTEIKGEIYGAGVLKKIRLNALEKQELLIDLKKSSGWYDLMVSAGNKDYLRHYAGHTETGMESISDPYMGGLI